MVYYSPYKQFFRALFRAIRVFFSSFFSKRLLVMIIIALVCILLHLNVHAVTQVSDYEYEIIQEWQAKEKRFVIFSLYPYFNDTDYWNNTLKPIYDSIKENNYDFTVQPRWLWKSSMV